MTNKELTEQITDVYRCIESGTSYNFAQLFSTITYCHGMYIGLGMNEVVMNNVWFDFIGAYISKYPKEAADQWSKSTSGSDAFLWNNLIIKITRNDPEKYKFADFIFSLGDSADYYSLMLGISVGCMDLEFFDYCCEHIASPQEYIDGESVICLLEAGQYEHLDKVYSNVPTEDLIKQIGRAFGVGMNRCEDNNLVKYFCMLADRYIPGLRDSSDRAALMSEYLEKSKISTMFCGLPDCFSFPSLGNILDVWEYMRENGLRFKNITSLMHQVFRYHNGFDEATLKMIREDLIPVIDDEPYVNVLRIDSEMMTNPQTVIALYGMIMQHKTLYLDFTDRCLTESDFIIQSKLDKKGKLSRFLKLKPKILTEDDLAGSKIAESLVGNSEVLEYVLQSREYPAEQMSGLIDLCIQKKALDSLNMIRRIQSGQVSSDLKRKK